MIAFKRQNKISHIVFIILDSKTIIWFIFLIYLILLRQVSLLLSFIEFLTSSFRILFSWINGRRIYHIHYLNQIIYSKLFSLLQFINRFWMIKKQFIGIALIYCIIIHVSIYLNIYMYQSYRSVIQQNSLESLMIPEKI